MKYEDLTKAELIAEIEALQASRSEGSDRVAPQPPDVLDTERLVAELQLHQFELEMQNRELYEIQQELEASRDRYADLYDFAPVGYATLDSKGCICEINLTAASLLGVERSRLLGTPLLSYVTRDDATLFLSRFRKCAKERNIVHAEFSVETRAGSIPVHVMFVPADCAASEKPTYRIAVTDISEQRKIEDRLREAQRMEVVGRLAGGIAHEFNNLLTIIAGHAELLLIELPKGGNAQGHASAIRDASMRAASLTRQLLAFGRRQMLLPRVLDLNAILSDMAQLLVRLMGEKIDLHFALDPALGRVHVDPSQLEQVLINLALNARDAMPDGGVLTIATANAELGGEIASDQSPTASSPYAAVSVTDTGYGMNAETLGHAFEPFFTTKDVGQGTGLGLASVYGIVEQSGGQVRAVSEPRVGTTITIYLPVSSVETVVSRREARSDARGTGETILLVEDEPDVRAAARAMLEKIGYRVVEASCASDAVRIYESIAESIDLLLTDMVMPGLDGKALAEEVRSRDPHLGIVFMSGYGEDTIADESLRGLGAMLLAKPFTLEAIASALRTALDRS